MKKFGCRIIMVLAMIMGVMSNAMAGGMYDNLPAAQKALEESLEKAKALNEADFMEPGVRETLKKNIIAADAVYDSKRFEDLEEINGVMPALLEAIDNAEKSVEEYMVLAEAVKQFVSNENKAIDEQLEELEIKYEDNEEMLDFMFKAVEDYRKMVAASVSQLKTKVTREMLEMIKSGKTVREVLAANSISLPTLKDVVDKAMGLQSVILTEKESGIEYNLSGNKVDGGYKGVVIKDGKKILRK